METQKQDNASLASGLRKLGIISLASSGAVFMLQGLFDMSSFSRFVSFAIVAAILGVLGILMGTKMKEPKSARAFLGLAAAATPVLFSQLGAMIYGFVSDATAVPNAFVVEAPSFALCMAALVATTVLMAPILIVGFGSLFRQQSRVLAALLMVSSFLLLIPTREPSLSALVIYVAVVLQAIYAVKTSEKKTIAGESDQWFARLITFVPAGILLGRGLFYNPNELFLAAGLAVIAVLLRALPNWHRDRYFTAIATTASAALAFDFVVAKNLWIGDARLMVVGFPAALFLGLLPEITGDKSVDGEMTSKFGGIAATFIALVSLVAGWSVLESVVSLCFGVVAIALGYTYRRRQVCIAGLGAAFGGLLYFADNGWRFVTNSPWISLAVLGVAALLSAGWLERNRHLFTNWTERMDARFKRDVQ